MASASDCANICSNVSLCGGFVYYSADTRYVNTFMTIPAGSCYPKSLLKYPNPLAPGSASYAYFNVPEPGLISNFLAPEEDVDYPYNDLPVRGQTGVYAATASACAGICTSIDACVGFVYFAAGTNSNACYPKSVMTAASNALIPAGAITYAYRSQRARLGGGDILAAWPALVLACLLCALIVRFAATKAMASLRAHAYEMAAARDRGGVAQADPDLAPLQPPPPKASPHRASAPAAPAPTAAGAAL